MEAKWQSEGVQYNEDRSLGCCIRPPPELSSASGQHEDTEGE
jgi:hypothetical protein